MFPFLAIETTDELCSVAIFQSEIYYYELNIKGKHVHSEKLLPMIEQLLTAANLEIDQLKFIAISEGPGSFTGLRIGMAAAKGLAAGPAIPLVLVPTFEALADKIKNYVENEKKFVIARKASTDELYFAEFQKVGNELVNTIPLKLMSKEDFESNYFNGDLVYSNLAQNKDFASPSAIDIGNWAYKFGKDLLTSNYDLVEPKYFKEFVVRR